jgi:uncharacterized membrane protein
MSINLGHIVLLYGLSALVFFLLDLIWLGAVGKGLYDRFVGSLLRDQVNWTAAIVFYFVYIGGILLFVSVPALKQDTSILRAAAMGALLGIFAYGTFDLTALALIRGWSALITVVDMVWGAVLTGGTVAAVLWLARSVFHIA